MVSKTTHLLHLGGERALSHPMSQPSGSRGLLAGDKLVRRQIPIAVVKRGGNHQCAGMTSAASADVADARKLSTFDAAVSSDGCNTSVIPGGFVVVDSSCEEGAGASAAVRQT